MKHTYLFSQVILSALAATSVACSQGSTSGTDTGTTTASDSNVSDTHTDSTTSTTADATTTTTPADTADSGGICGSATPQPANSIAGYLTPGGSGVATTGEVLTLTNIVVVGAKILQDKSSSSGECLFGVFVADAGTTFTPYSALELTSAGAVAAVPDGGGTAECAYPEDDSKSLLPADLAVGDTLTVTGRLSLYVPSSDGGTPLVANPEVELCSFSRTATGATPPPAAIVTVSDLTGPNLAKYVDNLVTVQNVTATTATATDTGCGSTNSNSNFCDFNVADTTDAAPGSGIAVDKDIYYSGWKNSPSVTVGQQFTSITGVMWEDYFIWSISPAAITNISPTPSTFGATDAGTDAATDAASGG